jgi:dual-specificity kinase
MRLDWPEGATSRESMKAVMKLPRLPVIFQNPTLLVHL